MEALAERNGIKLDMGDVKPVSEYLSSGSLGSGEDGPQPVVVASRVVAHLAHRFPLSKRITKRFEGRDKSAGIFSDFLTLLAQIADRNEELIKEQGADIIANIVSNNSKKSTADDGTHIEFGATTPISLPKE